MKRYLTLQIKLVVGLLVIASVPVAVSAVLIDRISEVAQNFASNEADRLNPYLVRAESAYRELVASKKEVFRQISNRLAADPNLLGKASIRSEGGLLAVAIDDGSGVVAIPVDGLPARDEATKEVVVRTTIPGGAAQLLTTFAARGNISSDYQELGKALMVSERVATVRRSLPSSYRTVFLLVIGGFAVILVVIGWLLGRGVTRRIAELVAATESVAKGDLGARAPVRGADELTDVASAFNHMVADLEAERRKSMYLQRIGTWQDVARKLAHEIKNPLTPIQLAVQQVKSSYSGTDERYASLLEDCEEIVGEEIASLRRLVDAFSSLGRLPRVDAKPIDFGLIVEDLEKDPVFNESLHADAPPDAINVAADRLLLRRVLANLVENGMQASSGGRVVVSWRADRGEGRAVICVDDSGPGVPAESAESVFDPYVTSKEQGTGLGLAISKKICIEHGGNLELSGKPAPTGGARFIVTVPLA